MPAPSWARIVNTTTQEYVKEEEVNVLRNRKVLAMMESRGRVSMNHSGDYLDWKVRWRRAPIAGYADADTLTFSRQNRWKTAQLDWRGYAATDSLTVLEELKNKDAAAIIKYTSNIAKYLMDDITEHFSDELYIDGEAAGNTKRMHGIESFMSNSGGVANGYVSAPNDTYAGLVCTLGNYGGSWSTVSSNTDWPSGTGDHHYDFWSPLVVDYTDTAWQASTKTWANTCQEAMRYGIIKSRKNKAKNSGLDLITLNDELFRLFEEKIAANERITIARGSKTTGLMALGFEDVITFEGVDVTYEYGIPSSVGYGWSMENVELCSLQSSLFVPMGPDEDISGLSKRFAITFFGNLKFNPRFFVKFQNVT